MAEVTSAPLGAGASSGDMQSTILADLVGSAGGNEFPAGATDPAITEEINAVPGDEEAEPLAVEGEQQATGEQQETEQVEDDSQKPAITNLEESRWKRVHGGYKWAQEVGRALGVVGEDGRLDLTLMPSVDEIKGMRAAYSDRIAMEHDFRSADPENAQTFVTNWNQFSPEGMAAVARAMPDLLAKGNTAAYVAMAQPVMGRFLDYMYKAPGVDTPELRQRLLDAARLTEWWMNGMPADGGYRTDQQIQGVTVQQQPDAREQQLARREQEIRAYEQRTATAAWDGFATSVNASIKTTLDGEVEKSLAALKPLYPNEMSYQAVRDRFVKELQQTLARDTVAQRQFEVAIEQAKRTRSAEDQQSLVALYMTMARRGLHTIRGPFVTNASKGFKQASDAKHVALQRSASKVGPTNAAAPRPQGITSKLERKKDETGAAFQQRTILADLGAA